MARTICGFVYGSKEICNKVEKDSIDMVLSEKGANAAYSSIVVSGQKNPFEYALIEFPDGGCLFEKHPSEFQLRMTLHFVGSEKLHEDKYSLAERLLKYWKDNDVRIGRNR
jgi:hypothetical protein